MSDTSLQPMPSIDRAEDESERRLSEFSEMVLARLGCRPAWEMTRNEQLELVRLTAEYLRARGAKRVWLFGSVQRGRTLGVHSDFDFAVEGLPSERFLGTLGRLLQILPMPVDLVELESASSGFRARIVKEGEVV